MKYYKELDGLRGFAILLVMMHHTGMHLFRGGFVGVDVFFVLSGFLISSILIQEYKKRQEINFRFFYMRRILRLAPLLILVVFLYWLINYIVGSKQVAHDALIDSVISLTYTTNWFWAFSIHPPDILRHTWSLSIEEQFYLIWPIVFVTILKYTKHWKPVVFFTVLIILASIITRLALFFNGASVFRMYNGLDTRIESLMVGCLITILQNFVEIPIKTKSLLSRGMRYLSPMALILIVFIVLKYNYTDDAVYTHGLTLVIISTGIILCDLIMNTDGLMHRLFSLNILVKLGVVSYGLYLIHYPIYRVMFFYGIDYKLITVFGIAFSCILAFCSYYFYERQFLKLKKHFSYSSVS